MKGIGLLGLAGMLLSFDVAAQFENDLECILEPNTEVELSTSVYGVLSDVLVERGDTVVKDQVLAKLISGREQAAVDLAHASVGFSERKAARTKELFDQSLISSYDMDEASTELQISQLQLQQSEEQLKLRTVISPIDGIVVERDKEPGEYVETESLLTVVSLDPLNVEVVVPAERYGTITLGMIGNVTTVGPLSANYQAEVTLIDQVIDAASETIRIRLALENPDNKIPAGLKCYVDFVAD